MNLSKKAAFELGRTLATSIHTSGGTNPVVRGGMLDAKNDILDNIPNTETRLELRRGFDTTLDTLEPLPLGGARWATPIDSRSRHIHAELMTAYAADAARDFRPWELWEFRDKGLANWPDQWQTLERHPSWQLNTDYRRIQSKEKVG